jgi:DNA-binding LytR/AlgR family response regulator
MGRREKLQIDSSCSGPPDPTAPADSALARKGRTEIPAPASDQSRVAFKTSRRILFVDVAEIVAVEARGNYVLMHRASSCRLLRESISAMEAKLNLYGFVRVHRSMLLNAAWVKEIHPYSTRGYVFQVAGGRQYVVSSVYKKNLVFLAQSWIGTGGFGVK